MNIGLYSIGIYEQPVFPKAWIVTGKSAIYFFSLSNYYYSEQSISFFTLMCYRLIYSSDPLFSSFHEFLKHESDVGNITRQEAVSMVGILYQFADKYCHLHYLLF